MSDGCSGRTPKRSRITRRSCSCSRPLIFLTFFLWRCSGMMLLGMALYKWGFLDGSRPTRTYALTASFCLPIGLALCTYGALELDRAGFALPERIILDLWNYAGAIFVSIGYAALIILAVKHGALSGLRRALAAVGQMALTNYLLHSIVASVLFLGWGFGLAGQFDYAEQLAIVVAIWAVQLALSPVWLAHYRFGPAEWLWRSLTYWQRQPLRREAHRSPSLGGAVAGTIGTAGFASLSPCGSGGPCCRCICGAASGWVCMSSSSPSRAACWSFAMS